MTNSRRNEGIQKVDAAGNPIVIDDKQEHQRTKAALRAMHDEKIRHTFIHKNRPTAASSSAALDKKITGQQKQENDDHHLALELQDRGYTSTRPPADTKHSDHKTSVLLAKNDMTKPALSAASGTAAASSSSVMMTKATAASDTLESNVEYKNPTSTLEKILLHGVTKNVLFPFLDDVKDLKSATAFVQTSKLNRLSSLFKQKTLNNERDKRVKKLCQAVVYGEYDKVKAILEKNPSLVLYKARVQDYSYHETDELDRNGRKKRIYRESEGTAYQLALATDDVNRAILDEFNQPVLDEQGNIQILHPNEGMAEMIQSYFIKAYKNDIKSADAEIQRQQQEQFPAGYEETEAARKLSDLNALSAVIQAIGVARVEFINRDYLNSNGEVKLDAKCEVALKQFHEYLMPKGVIISGKHFNVELLSVAFQLYDKKFNDFGGDWGSPKNVLFWRKIIGYIQRYSPACLAQAFCSSLYDVIYNGKLLLRSLVYKPIRHTFFPLDNNPRVSLGIHIAWTANNGQRCVEVPERVERQDGLSRAFQNLYQAKKLALASLSNIKTINRSICLR